MPLNEREIADALSERQDASRVLDRWDGLRSHYRDFQRDLVRAMRIYRNEWYMKWPDGRIELVEPSVHNVMRSAADDRANTILATPPSVVCHPEGPGDKAREKADKLERIVSGHFADNRIQQATKQWAYDAMLGGLTVCKVNLEKRDGVLRPTFRDLDPAFSYPDPIFSPGPYLDSFMYSYEDKRRTVENRYGVELEWKRNRETDPSMVRVIEFYDNTWYQAVAQQTMNGGKTVKRQTLMARQHGLGKCPVVISGAIKADRCYSGEFISGLGALEYWDRLMRMIQDDAIRKVYAERVTYGVENARDWGPDAEIELENAQGRYEYVQNPNQPFSNMQTVAQAGGSVRDAFIMPLARTGNPDQSIISAAGINASQGQYMEDVRAIQRDVIAPMLEAGMALALTGEEKWTPNTTKTINAGDGRYAETYVPSKDIDGYRSVEIRYGPMSALDPINQAVLVQQFHGNKLMSARRVDELNPMIEDPQREEKQRVLEGLQEGMIAGLLQRAVQGTLDPAVLAIVMEAVNSDEVTLEEAVKALVAPAPMQPATAPAAPTAPGPGLTPAAPGIPGAAGGQVPQSMPPLGELVGGPTSSRRA